MWKNGVGRIESSSRAMLDLSELDTPLRRMIRPI
jgi:hypothetical protein